MGLACVNYRWFTHHGFSRGCMSTHQTARRARRSIVCSGG